MTNVSHFPSYVPHVRTGKTEMDGRMDNQPLDIQAPTIFTFHYANT